ncbi:hypothetical protein PLICRDRAFT_34667 [Plicaturopsis crispa FD-325 SS-3]|nr:hypothetical protein PLICRDRAFT_34667 [Plicaturopsis crispa FD-325 SS-3]
MASLLERLDNPGPVRSKQQQQQHRSAPYARPSKTPTGDVDGPWSHDLFHDPASASTPANKDRVKSLAARISSSSSSSHPRTHSTALAQKALAHLAPSSQLSIKGASTSTSSAALAKDGNVVEIRGLAPGTSTDDVEAIFKSVGPLLPQFSTTVPSAPGEIDKAGPTVRVAYKAAASARAAVAKFHGAPADGRTLSVRVVGIQGGGGLAGRLLASGGIGIGGNGGGGGGDAMDLDRSVDVLLSSAAADGGSKMRSDTLLAAPGAQVLVAPPGADPREYTQAQGGSWRGRGGARGGGGRGKRGGRGRRGGMDVD